MRVLLRRASWRVGLIIVCLLAASASLSGQDSESIHRLPPSAFKELPHSIVRKLVDRRCLIPQVDAPHITRKTNVIHGEFARAGQVDWAVLCSKGGQSTILIFWGKDSKCPSQLNTAKDADIRYIDSVSEGDLLRDADPPTPGLMKHQAIDDGFDGKGSMVYYCTDGQWKIVAGAD
jgi:hypothetical protein